jgi:cysteinyl-tRNA synthetase
MLQIYNTLSKEKEVFKPLNPGKIGIYVCGITVYDYCHIGHGRMLTVFDMVTRYLRDRGFSVDYVRNITDIDDKIIKRAQENGEGIEELTERFIAAMNEDTQALGILAPDHEPRATQHIPDIIAMIERLMANGYAYQGSNNDIYYRVSHFKHYGELAHQDLEKLRSGARIEVTEVKEDPLDFVLWKHAKPGEPQWESPWGPGRPGWHIECSAMSTALLGKHFDIHGGGIDLVFPHHQNEIAQSEGANPGCRFVNLWMHNGFIQVNMEKMSKSLGNFFIIRDALKAYDPESLRYFFLASHYRSPINYTEENLKNAHAALARFYTALKDLPVAKESEDQNFVEQFYAAMDDDFNTPVAFSVLFDLVREINRCREQQELGKAAAYAMQLKRLAGILGFLQQDPVQFLQAGADDYAKEIEALIEARKLAREQRNWQEADRIRAQLTEMGVVLEDNAQGTAWRKGG